VEVRLQVPPPLATPLTIERRSPVEADLLGEGGELIASARVVADVDLEAPEAATPAVAGASARPLDPASHPFPTCFVCGPGRDDRDGLRIFAGPVAGDDGQAVQRFAAPWIPDDSLPNDAGVVANEIVWAALDCPGGQAVLVATDQASAVVLGTITASHDQPVIVGRTYTLTSWLLGREGRKFTCGALLADEHGTVIGRSRAIWIAVA
jgi:hypothetical protein